MTVDELQTELLRRRARLMVDFVGGDVSVMLTHVPAQGKAGKTASAVGAKLSDALETALLRYDGVWKP